MQSDPASQSVCERRSQEGIGTMKAVTINEHGGLECLQIEDVAVPEPAENEVVVRVAAAALNHLDIWIRKGRPGIEIPMPHILGSDASGVVAKLGTAVRHLDIGQEVIINPAISCGKCEFCVRGDHTLCPSFGIIGFTRPGTFAEQVCVSADKIHPKPPHLDFPEAAALPLAYVTAWRMLFTRAGLKPGQTVLIHGIGGGVALAALQLAKMSGATVIVTSSSNEKLALSATLGSDHGINYKTAADLAGQICDITGGRGVDIAVDSVGRATWPIDFAVVRRGGCIVLCGVTSGPAAHTSLQRLYWNQLTIMGSTMGSDEDFRQMLRAVTACRLKPVIDSVKPLESATEAMARMENARQFGKIVLTPNDDLAL